MKKLMVIAVVVGAVRSLVSRRGKVVLGKVRGLVSSALPKQYDDGTLKAKVESELFRYEQEVKGVVNINAQQGTIQLRGELPSRDLIQALVERTKKIHGVRDVENLLHTPGTEAPMHH